MKARICALALAFGLAAPAAQAQDGPVAIGTLPQGSLGYAIAAGVANVVSQETELSVRAVGQGGSSVFIPALNRGEIAFSTSNAFEAVFAVTGTGNFDGQPNPDVRVAAMLQPFEVGIMVPEDSDIREVTDLKGRPFSVGYARQTLVGVIQNAVFAAARMSAEDLDGVPVPNFVEGAELLAQGAVDGVLLAPGSGVVKRTHAQRPVRFLSVPKGEAAAAIIEERLPGAYVSRVEPSDRLPEIEGPTDLVGYQYALLTHAGADDDMVYAAVKAIHANKARLVEAHGSFRGFEPSEMANRVEGAPFHPAAIRYYKEIGIWEE